MAVVSAATLVGIAGAAAGTDTPQTPLVDAFWVTPESGDWSNDDRWSDGVVPNDLPGEVRYHAFIQHDNTPFTVMLTSDIGITNFTFTPENPSHPGVLNNAALNIDTSRFRVEGDTLIQGGRLTGTADGSIILGNAGLPGGSISMNGTTIDSLGLLKFEDDAVLTDVTIEGAAEGPMVIVETAADGRADFTDASFTNAELNFRGDGSINQTFNSTIDDTCVGVGPQATVSLTGDGGSFGFRGNSDLNVGNGGVLLVNGPGTDVNGDGTGNQAVNIDAGGALVAGDGGNHTFFGLTINNQGTIEVDTSASFSTDGIDVIEGRLEGGAFVVRTNATVDLGESVVVEDLAASVTLSGGGSTFNGLGGLQTISSGGELAVRDGRAFSTDSSLEVRDGGTLEVGGGSSYAIGGALSSFDSEGGVLFEGAYIVGGILTATNINSIERVEADLTLTGGGQIGNGQLTDAISGLTSIGETGSVSALDGRSILGLDSLTVEGTLRVGASSDTPSRVDDADNVAVGTVIGVDGDYVQAEGSQLIIQIDQNGTFGRLDVEGDVVFGDDGTAGTLIFELFGDIDLGDSFVFLTADEIMGTFDNVEAVDGVTGAAVDLGFTIDIADGVIRATAVPAPHTLAVLAGAAAFIRRRR